MAFTLPALPYSPEALEPHISANTLGFHHGKHHNAYVNKLNELVAGGKYEGKSLEEIVLATAGVNTEAPIFNNAAQVWNHTFFWNSMAPNSGACPAHVKSAIEAAFGSLENFKKEFVAAAVGQFGSGWAWLVRDAEGKLKITKTGNAESPIHMKQTPIMTVDVWEHAYYLDYQNRRPDFVGAVLEHLLNWSFIAKNLG